jgi:hypothetical protein
MFSLCLQGPDRLPSSHGGRRGWALLTVAVAALAIAGCGSSSSISKTTKSSAASSPDSTSTTGATSSATPTPASTSITGARSSATSSAASTSTTGTSAPGQGRGTASVTAGPVRGTLHAANHSPIVNKNWPYSDVVTDAARHPLSGTVDVEFTFGGQVVGRDTPPTHPLKNGRWSENLQFPEAAVGEPLTFQLVVHTHLGSITLDWPVTVKQ